MRCATPCMCVMWPLPPPLHEWYCSTSLSQPAGDCHVDLLRIHEAMLWWSFVQQWDAAFDAGFAAALQRLAMCRLSPPDQYRTDDAAGWQHRHIPGAGRTHAVARSPSVALWEGRESHDSDVRWCDNWQPLVCDVGCMYVGVCLIVVVLECIDGWGVCDVTGGVGIVLRVVCRVVATDGRFHSAARSGRNTNKWCAGTPTSTGALDSTSRSSL